MLIPLYDSLPCKTIQNTPKQLTLCCLSYSRLILEQGNVDLTRIGCFQRPTLHAPKKGFSWSLVCSWQSTSWQSSSPVNLGALQATAQKHTCRVFLMNRMYCFIYVSNHHIWGVWGEVFFILYF